MRVRKPTIYLVDLAATLENPMRPDVAEFTPYGVIYGLEASTSRHLLPWHLVDHVEFDKALLIGDQDQPRLPGDVSAPEFFPNESQQPQQLQLITYQPREPERFAEGRYRSLVPGDVLALPVSKDGQPTGDIRVRGEVATADEYVRDGEAVIVVTLTDGREYVADRSERCYVENPQWRSWRDEGVARLPDGSRIRKEESEAPSDAGNEEAQ